MVTDFEELQAAARTGREQCALLVDDSHHDQWLIKRALETVGRQVRLSTAISGDEAMAYLGGIGVYADRFAYPVPAVVLLDIKMPRRSGFEVLQWLRDKGGDLKNMPVVMLSSSDQLQDIERAYEQGANGYVVKPGSHDELKKAMNNICSFWLDENRPPNLTCMSNL
jgi:CheY-like chemotaxis protein